MSTEHVASQPVFAWTRVDQNRRATRVLTGLMVIALAPIGAAATIWIAPWGMLLLAALASFWVPLQRIVIDARPEQLLRIQVGIFAAAFVIGSAVLTVIATWGIHRFAARMILARASARRVDRTNPARLCRAVDNQSIGAGLLAPDVYIIDAPVPNAFSTSRDTQTASLIVTTGLLIRNAATRSRDFLADADAVLMTQDPEGLARALAKVQSAQGPSSRALLATSRLLFGTPRSQWAGLMGGPSLIDARIDELISMGTGFDRITIARGLGQL